MEDEVVAFVESAPARIEPSDAVSVVGRDDRQAV